MRKPPFACGLLVAVALWPSIAAAATPYKAVLRGDKVKPPVATQGTGRALVEADPATKSISWTVTFHEISSPVVSADMRCAARVGARGAGIAAQLGSGAKLRSPLAGRARLTDAQFADLQDGRCRINIGTVAHRAGEIAGRLHH